MEVLIQTLGWIGTLLIVSAYYLVSSKKLTGNNRTYQAMNLFGAIGVGIHVFYQEAWPAVALQSIWGIIAILSLIKTHKD